nr:fibronectin type III domain-containing protein [Micromonospora sp. DSM 115978]
WSADGAAWNTAATFNFATDLARIGVWAGNAATPAPAFTSRVDYVRLITADATAPAISAVAAVPASDSAIVTWTTDEPASSQVEFGLTTGYGMSAGTSALTTSHAVTLTGLSCETDYHFRPASTDAGGNLGAGADQLLTTGECPPPDTSPPTISNVAA